jgi:hypothetical protein
MEERRGAFTDSMVVARIQRPRRNVSSRRCQFTSAAAAILPGERVNQVGRLRNPVEMTEKENAPVRLADPKQFAPDRQRVFHDVDRMRHIDRIETSVARAQRLRIHLRERDHFAVARSRRRSVRAIMARDTSTATTRHPVG